MILELHRLPVDLPGWYHRENKIDCSLGGLDGTRDTKGVMEYLVDEIQVEARRVSWVSSPGNGGRACACEIGRSCKSKSLDKGEQNGKGAVGGQFG